MIMSKWEAIAKTTGVVSKGLNDLWEQKLKKDASVIIGDSWSNFVLDSANFFNNAQNHIDVAIDPKTGTLACLMNLPDNHPDYKSHNQPFSSYVLNSVNKGAISLVDNTKNPYAKRLLQDKISNYKTSLANQIAGFEANIVMDKRQNMAVENIEKLAKATYTNPKLYNINKEDALIAINSLDIDPAHKAQLARKATSDIAKSAANAVLINLPASILDSSINYEWKKDLDVRSLIQLERGAIQSINHAHAKNMHEFEQLSKIHFDNILKHGEGIDGIETKLSSLPESEQSKFVLNQKLHIKAHDILEKVKNLPISEENNVVASFMTIPFGAEGYLEQVKLYKVIKDTLDKQQTIAQKDPALYVDQLFATNNIEDRRELGEKMIDRLQWQQKKGIPSYKQKVLTNEEKEEFCAIFNSRDPNVIKAHLDNILQIEYNHQSLGHRVLEEILLDTKLPALTHFYIDAHLYSRGNIKNDLAKAMVSKQALAEMSKPEKDALKTEIAKNMSDWQASILAGKTEEAPKTNLMRAGLLELARYYQFEKHLSMNEAVDMAVKNLLDGSYIVPYTDWKHGKFYIPKSVLEDKDVIELNPQNINFGLKKLRADIINHHVKYDKESSFGLEYYTGEAIKSREVNYALRGGAFRLTHDKRSVYYVYFDNNGEHPLLKSDKKIFTIDLLDLNKTQSSNDQMINDNFELDY